MLNVVLQFAMLVLRDLAVFFELAQYVDAVAPHIAHRYAGLLGIFGRDPGQFAAPLFVEVGDRHADHLAFALRVEAQPRLTDRLVDSLCDAAIPHLNCDHPGLRHADIGHLVQRHHVAIGFDLDRLQQACRGAAGAQTAKFLAQYLDRTVHAAREILQQ